MKAAGKKEDSEIRDLLANLYPGENISVKYQEYRMRKNRIVVTVMVIGLVAFVGVQISSQMHDRLKEGTHLTRNEWGEGSYFVTLQARTATKEGEVSYQVEERHFTKEELEAVLPKAREALLQIILAKNTSLNQVSGNLKLVSELEGYPFSITWKSSDYEKVQTDGRVNVTEVPKEGEKIRLTAVFAYEERIWEQEIFIKLVPAALSPREEFLRNIKELLAETDISFAEKTKIILPGQLDGEGISWQEKKENSGFWLLLLGVAGAFFCAYGMDNELRKKNQLRKEEMVKSYPEFVSRLKLYMGAGLTARNAFLRIGRDYQKEKKKTGQKIFLYEELLISGYQLMNGKSEDMVYREWGRRCEVMCCRKLGFLLTSSLRQGNEKILSLLEKEACYAWEERKSKARKQGEEAGTKMLFPMLLMLLMVMFLILLPAFTGLQGM